jgi:hypothetical protein
MLKHQYLLLVLLTVAIAQWSVAASPDLKFLQTHCADCHTGEEAEAGFDLSKLGTDLLEPAITERWVRIHDRVAAGEMPPPDYADISEEVRREFLDSTSEWIQAKQTEDFATRGRVRGRRLTNLQLERTLHDLLGIDIPLATHFPAEPKTHGYTTVADGQPMSHFQMEQHLAGVDRALEEAFRRALSKDNDDFSRHLDAKGLSRTNPRRRCREPEIIDDHGVVWSSGMMFYGRIPATTARESGWYEFTIRAKGLNLPKDYGIWCTLRRGRCVSSAPLLADVGTVEVSKEPQEWKFQTWLPAGEMLEIRPGDNTLKKGRFAGGQVGAGEGSRQNVPGVAIEWIKMKRIHQGADDEEIRTGLFGDLELQPHEDWRQAEVVSQSPKEDITKLMTEFAQRAFRRPVTSAEVQPYIDFVYRSLDDGESFATALRGGYRGLLCSPRFMYFQELPGKLDDYAVASRLSYLVWNSMPDAELFRLADSGSLTDRSILDGQVQRMLVDPRGKNFVKDFADQWLDLSEIDFTEPDRRMFGKFDLVVQSAMLAETQAFLQTLIDEDLSATQLIDSDFTYLNSRLARYYQLEGVSGDTLQRVTLPEDSVRGGLLGQGAILKVTANGTTTSPVIRGVWVSERLLGKEIPSPPNGVPAIEPDIRGAKTIREQLAKHKSIDACASCHKHIDPPGFALENFDPAGNWRSRYLTSSRKPGAEVDASYELPDGRAFNDINQFRKRILENPEVLAHNFVIHLITYGTGAPVQFSDRQQIDQIVEATAKSSYGFRSLISATVTSPIFLSK